MPAPDALDLERYPLDRLEAAPGRALVERCRAALARDGLARLPGFLRPEAFEFVPHLRSDDGEDLEGMRRAQTGTHPALVRPPATPGTLSLFEGRYHYHRATRVRGGRERLLALLQYGARLEDPDEPSVRALNRLFYGRPD